MLWSLFAADPPRRPGWLSARPYAHRGLHGDGRTENSRAAFEAAILKGFGIELDVRASACGTAFVFHDAELDRLCGAAGRFDARDRAGLAALRLEQSDEPIPTLKEVLHLVGGRVPLLIELKSDGGGDILCREVLALLDQYRGDAAIMSFDPRLVAWFARRAPKVVRGLVVSEQNKGRLPSWIVRRLAVGRCRPDFLAYDVHSLPSRFAARSRRRGRAILSWTVRTLGDADTAEAHADQIIHELAPHGD